MPSLGRISSDYLTGPTSCLSTIKHRLMVVHMSDSAMDSNKQEPHWREPPETSILVWKKYILPPFIVHGLVATNPMILENCAKYKLKIIEVMNFYPER